MLRSSAIFNTTLYVVIISDGEHVLGSQVLDLDTHCHFTTQLTSDDSVTFFTEVYTILQTSAVHTLLCLIMYVLVPDLMA